MSDEQHLSSDAEQYQEEIQSLRTQVKSLEFQIADLKTYIVNQRNMHARELQAVRNTERQLQEKVAKLTKDAADAKNHPVVIKKSLKEPKEPPGMMPYSLVKELLHEAFCSLEGASSELFLSLHSKINSMGIRLRKSQLYLSNMKLVAETHRDNQHLLLMTLRSTLQQKNNMLDHQNKFIEQMMQDKRESDSLYERHLTYLESSRDQKKMLAERLDRASTEFNQFGSLRDSTALRRIVEGSISFSKDAEGKHQPDSSVVMHATLPHFTGFPLRTSNPTVLQPFDENASCYHKTTNDLLQVGGTEREPTLKSNRVKLKNCFRRAMSNLASPNKYPGSHKCLEARSPLNEDPSACIKANRPNATITAVNRKKVASKRVDLTVNHALRQKQNLPFC